MKYWERPFGKSKPDTLKGEVYVVEDRCKGCNFCVEYCPRDVLELSDRFNKKGYHPPEVIKPDQCTGCKLCEMICPDFAIYVIEKEKDDKKTE